CIGQPQVRSLAHLCPSPPEPLPRRAAGRGFPPPARDRRPRRPLPRLPPPRRSGRIDLVTHAAAACDLCGQAESAELFEIRICADCRDAPTAVDGVDLSIENEQRYDSSELYE